ncbi:right-handed parallel beta-helix repeat-containing protein [Marinicella rhabdoformis]|uniref:right-handed parallel beta-helix repeat-containing protein n=1 Tax=Marinicella rhabdoformis TaxID=2580566 RepID=UPI0012AECCBD|nr:right-handed parallel beta-helix repeat-containing protein [Marinicella rhabdoformis]
MKIKTKEIKNQYHLKRKALVSSVLFALSGLGQSALIQVGSDCSLVEAIEAANTDAVVNSCVSGNGDDIIQLPPVNSPLQSFGVNSQHEASTAIPGTYVGLPIINSHITIDGQGNTIQGSTGSNLFRIFELAAGSTLILNDVTVAGGDDGLGIGSGVLNYAGFLEVNNSTLSDNHGAVASMYGQTSLNNSVVVSNFADNSNTAAGIFAYSSLFELNNSSVINNRLTEIPPLWGQRSSKGKIDLKRGGSGPVAGGIQLINSESKLINSTISGNKGFIGGLTITEQVPPAISKHLNKGNVSNKGGPSYSTLISHVTLSDNTGYVGGFAMNASLASMTLEATIISGNKTEALPEYANGYVIGASAVITDAHNFIGDNGQTKVYGLPMGASDVVFTNSVSDNLYPLNLTNGQFVQPLKHGSIAIDGLAKSCYQNLVLDQEGKGRGIDGDTNGSFICDAGAFEHSLPIIVNGGACTLQNAMVSANNDASVGGCQPGNGHDIIELPEGSTHTHTVAADVYNLQNQYYFGSGLPVVRSGMIINGNNSLVERDTSSLEDFNLFTVADENGLILNDVTVTGANTGLAAVASWYGSEIQLFNSNVIGNQTMGVLSVLNHISGIEKSNISNNMGEAQFSHLPSGLVGLQSANFRLSETLISNNSGTAIGGAQLSGNMNMVVKNNTISGNEGITLGGLQMAQNQGLITNNTITKNEGQSVGGFYGSDADNVTLSNNIISGNILVIPPPSAGDKGGGTGYAEMNMVVSGTPLLVSRNNIIGQNGNSGTNHVFDLSDVTPPGSVDTVIEPILVDNGGTSMTHLPILGGLAIDSGSSSCELNRVDQRGFIRPWDGNSDGVSLCDVGAVELNSVHEDDLIFKDGFDEGVVP